MTVQLGINPLTWTNDDLPSLGAETSLDTCLSEGKEAGTMLTEIGYIKGGIDRIERKQDAQDARYIGMAERMSAVESSAKSAHHRIDRLEGREVREDG